MTIRRRDEIRFVGVTDANIRESHLYLTGHFDFFPTDSYGPPSKKSGTGHLLQLHVEGLPELRNEHRGMLAPKHLQSTGGLGFSSESPIFTRRVSATC